MVAKKIRKPNFPKPPASDAPPIDWALWCANAGRLTRAFKVFPLRPGDKRPLRKGWQDESACDPKTVETMWQNDPKANIGLAMGSILQGGPYYDEPALNIPKRDILGRLSNTKGALKP